MSKISREDLIKELNELREKERLKKELPHRYLFKEYKWQQEFKNSTNRMKLLCAANQISKSSSLIQHNIDLAGDKSLWKKFFPLRKPKVFWYIYPTQDKIEEELATKWPEFLPQGSEKAKGPFSWKATKVGKSRAIKFLETDVLIIFKSWGVDLQSGTADMISCDEEIPADIYPELSMRIARYDGVFNMVFTATLGQKFWYQAIERIGEKDERFKEAFKLQVSMEHDCEFYADGSPSPWTKEAVQARKRACGSKREIDRRIHGRFVTDEGLKYSSFKEERNCVESFDENIEGWLHTSGLDHGSGGPTGHPAAMGIIAIKPDFTKAVIRKLWKGNKKEETTASDVLERYKEMVRGYHLTTEYYDWGAKDIKLLAERHGFSLMMADKNHDNDVLNVLFKNEMLVIDKSVEFSEDLIYELKNLRSETPKQKAEDDLIDVLRYALSNIPWNIETIREKVVEEKKTYMRGRHEYTEEDVSHDWDIEDQINEINELAGGYF